MSLSTPKPHCKQGEQSLTIKLCVLGRCLIPNLGFNSSHEYGRRQSPVRLACAVALTLWGVLSASAQQPEDLQQQLQGLKRQYEETTQQLQSRIAALEQQIEKQKEASGTAKEGAISAGQLAEKAARNPIVRQSDQAGAKFQGQLSADPMYDLLR